MANGSNDPRSKADLLDEISDLQADQAALDAVADIVAPPEDDVVDDDDDQD